MSSAIPDTKYLFRMTDTTGLLQHAVSGIPDPTHGYTTDDNARALIAAALLYQRTHEPVYEQLLVRYMSFLLYAEKGGWFRNFMDYNRTFLEEKGSEDSFGRCICALCYVVTQSDLPRSVKDSAASLLTKTLPFCSSVQYPHGIAYTLAGLTFLSWQEVIPVKKQLTAKLLEFYSRTSTGSWHWFNNEVTYCSGIFPFALFRAGLQETEKKTLSAARESLEFLARAVFRDGIFKPIGCKGWYQQDSDPAVFDEQPVEACSMLLACREAYIQTSNSLWRERAGMCYKWYRGKNILGKSVIDSETGGCFDGITDKGFNTNQGAESIVCWLISALVFENGRR